MSDSGQINPSSFNVSNLILARSGSQTFWVRPSDLARVVSSAGSLMSAINVSAGGTSNNLSAVTFNNSNGVSFGLTGSVITATVKTDYLTTAAQSNQVVNSLNGSTGQISLNVGISLSSSTNGSSITFGLASNITTALQSAGNYLTTARASTDAIGLNTAITANGVSMTANSSGLSLNFPAFLTTAALSNHSHNLATTTTNGSVIVVATTNSAGATIAVPPFLTTAQSAGNYLTTARASNDAIGLNTAQSNVTWTVNSSGLSFDARGYAGTGISATNATITLNSNGLAISVAAPGAGGAVNFSAGTTSNNLQSVVFATGNGITFGLGTGASSQSITASHNGLTTARASTDGIGLNTEKFNVTWTVNSSGLTLDARGYAGTGTTVGATNLSASATLNSNGLNFAISGPLNATMSSYFEGQEALTMLTAPGNGICSLVRFQIGQDLSASMIGLPVYQSISSSAVGNTYGQQWSVYAMVLTNDSANSRLMSLSSGSTQTTFTVASNTAGVTQMIGSGVRPITVPVNMNMTPGIYYMAFNWSTNTFSSGTASTALNRTISMMGRSPIQSASFAMVSNYNVATGVTNNVLFPQGCIAASNGIPTTISHSTITMTGASASAANLAFYFRA